MKKPLTVRVRAHWRTAKGRYCLKWTDPFTGNERTQQTDIFTRNKRSKSKADRLAEIKQQELLEEYARSDWTWDDFVERYKDCHLKFTSKDNQYKWNAVASFVLEAAAESREISGPLCLEHIRPRFLTDVETLIRLRLASGSVSSYMGTLRSGLSWAATEEMMLPLPRRRKSPGREEEDLPAYSLIEITQASLRKMTEVCPNVVGKKFAKSVQDYLIALWLSGCRMREPLTIHATRADCHRPIDLDGKEPEFFWTTSQKSKTAGVHRIPLDFAADVKRRIDDGGFLYQPRCETGVITDRTALSNVVSAIGKKAEVFVRPGKTATAKYFRTSFAQRWSDRGMPLRLVQDMLKHQSEETTKKYYRGNSGRRLKFDESRFGDQTGDLFNN